MQPDIDRLLSESAWVKNLARRLLRDAHDAEEISQEVIAKALTDAPIDRGPRLRAWLATVTRRLAASRAKRDGLRRQGEESAARPEAQEADLDSGLALHRVLVQAVDKLPQQMREVILLRYFQDLPPRAIVKRLKLTPEAVSKRLSRARQQLRGRLDRLSDPENRVQGRALWCAALTESFGPAPTLPALLIMPTQTKIALTALSTVLLLALGWRTLRAPSPLPGKPVEPEVATLVEPLTVPNHEPRERKPAEREAVHKPKKYPLNFRVRTSPNGIPKQARAYWFEANGRPRGIALNQQGEGRLIDVPESALVWVCADGWTTNSCRHDSELELQQVVLRPAERIYGTIVEDGGPPLFPFSMIARWNGPEAETRIRGGMRKVLGIGKRQTDVFVQTDGSFELANLPADQTVELVVPSSHVLDRKTEDLVRSGRAVRLSTSADSAVFLKTYRMPSVRGKLVRSDDRTKAADVKVTVWLYDRQGKNHVTYGMSDSRGSFSLGLEVQRWGEFSDEERAAFRAQFDRMICHFAPEDSPLRGNRITRDLQPNPFPIDLGTIALVADAMPKGDRILLLDHSGSPVHQGAVGTPKNPTRTDYNGVAEIPKLEKGEAPLYAFALEHAPKLFDPRELTPDSNGLLTVQLERGYELLVTVEDAAPGVEYLVDISWRDSPFLGSRTENGPPPYSLQQALLPPSRVLQDLWPRGSLDQREVHWSRITAESPVRLSALLPGAEIGVLLRGSDGAIHDEREFTLSKEPGATTISLTPRELRTPIADEFVLVGSVRDILGQPIAGAKLILERDGRNYHAHSSKDGSIRIGPLRRSEFQEDPTINVKAGKEGYVREQAPWKTSAVPPPELHFVMHRERELDIYFEDERGEPQSVRSVEIYVDGEHFRSAHEITPYHVRPPFMKELPAEAKVRAGLEVYRFSIPAHVTEMHFVLPVHGRLRVPEGTPPTGANLRLHIAPLDHSARQAGSFGPGSRSGWIGTEYESVYSSMTIELLPGRYAARWNDGVPEEFEIVAGETTEFRSQP